jgi:hypothetical protein
VEVLVSWGALSRLTSQNEGFLTGAALCVPADFDVNHGSFVAPEKGRSKGSMTTLNKQIKVQYSAASRSKSLNNQTDFVTPAGIAGVHRIVRCIRAFFPISDRFLADSNTSIRHYRRLFEINAELTRARRSRPQANPILTDENSLRRLILHCGQVLSLHRG